MSPCSFQISTLHRLQVELSTSRTHPKISCRAVLLPGPWDVCPATALAAHVAKLTTQTPALLCEPQPASGSCLLSLVRVQIQH